MSKLFILFKIIGQINNKGGLILHPYHLIMNKIVKRNFAITTTEDIVSKINDASKQFFVIENNKPYGAVRGKRKNDVHYVACLTIQSNCPLKIAIEYMKDYRIFTSL